MPNVLSIRKVDGKPGSVYYPLQCDNQPTRSPKDNEVVVRMHAAALNHRDLFIRQHLYPAIAFGVPLLADGCGTVTSTGSSPTAKKWLNRRVVINPGTGWRDDPDGPEDPNGYKILGGSKVYELGTAVEELVIDAGEVEEAPRHLSDAEAAALPLAGLTAWRATTVKSANAKPGRNLLVTGIGGGVAIMALLFAVKAGADVYVTSGSQEKLDMAVKMGAKGGVIYKEGDWDKKLRAMLPKERPLLDAIIDGAGSDIVDKAARLLKPGGVISIYGMTTSPKMSWSMAAVLKNIELRGSTMGSRKEFADMIEFVRERELKPVVSKISKGLDDMDSLNALFEEMKSGSQFGKLVIEISKEGQSSRL
ncbi:MAG: hypothetical protein M1828_001065 [Chrysothrix sp. TS-e1954]|nr:MAG: hypothetical protein M1828_001065 [Chrysothrix sp. TS-e1954]